MRKTRILAWALVVSLIGWLVIKNIVSAGNWIIYNPDAWVSYTLNWDENFTAWTITISDWTKTITILDRNLWATTTWYGNTTDTWSYWYHFQWWNNHGFEWCYANRCDNFPGWESTTTTKPDTSGYWPWNYYDSDTFIFIPSWNFDWSATQNDNLWWWAWDDETNWYGLTSQTPIIDRQWPCPEWYHVPSIWERNQLFVMRYNSKYDGDLTTEDLVYLTSDSIPYPVEFVQDMLIPFAWVRDSEAWEWIYVKSRAFLWASSADIWWSYPVAYLVDLRSTTRGNPKTPYYIMWLDIDYRGNASSVRCFKDENEEIEQKTVTFNVLSGEDIISTWFNISDEVPTSGQILDAISRLSDEIGLATWYHFVWYVDDGWVETKFDLDTAISQWSITSSLDLTWQIEPNKYIISFLDENELEIMTGEFVYDQESTLPVNTSTKEWYTFKWWKDEQWNTYMDWASITNLATEDGIILIFTPIREENYQPSAGGWWWSSSWWGKIVRPDTKTEEKNTDKDNEYNQENEMWHGSAEAQNNYSQEMNDAYKWAYKNWITTMDSIEKADMTWWLTRIAMAKMLSYYAINVLSMKPDETRVNKFGDVTSNLSAQYDNWVNLAYQLWIMWINMQNNMFRPFDLVTRAEFGTALSRMIYWLADGKILYYETHLKKLADEKIITNDNPNLRELRWYVMIMLMRSTMTGDDLYHYLEWIEYTEYETNIEEQEIENYFTEAYKVWKIYYKIWDLQRLLRYLWFYNWEINNTFDMNTVDAVFDFQVAMWILDANDKSPTRWYLWPSTRSALNQKWAEFK